MLGIGFETSSPLTLSSSSTNNVQKTTEAKDNFDFFSNVSPSSSIVPSTALQQKTSNGSPNNNNSLKQEEDDFFNQKTVDNGGIAEKGKMTKDSILALFNTPQVQPPFNANFQQYPRAQQEVFCAFGQQPVPQAQQQSSFGNFGNFNSNFSGTMQTQQINKLNEENIKKIESLNFNSFK